MQSLAQDIPRVESGFFSSESVLNILKLILAGSELSEVLTIIARIGRISRQRHVMHHLASRRRRKASLLRSRTQSSWICRKRRAHVCWPERRLLRHGRLSERAGLCCRHPPGALFGTTIVTWFLPYGIRAVWSRPLFTREGKVLGTFAILYREVRNPDAIDLQLIENASHIAGIAIERHLHEEALRHERDRLRLASGNYKQRDIQVGLPASG